MNDHPSSQAGSPPEAMDLQGRRRRAALLNGLANGSALGAAVLPMSSHASGAFGSTVDIPSGRHCSVSGFQSTTKSKASAEFCGAYTPAYFIFVRAASEKTAADKGIIIGSGAGALWISAKDWSNPTKVMAQDTLSVAGMLDNSGSDATLALQALYDMSDAGYFIAAYLSAALVSAPSGRVHVPFPPSYVVAQYNSGSYSGAAVSFFRALCVFS